MKIGYNERAYWDEFVSEDTKFIQDIIVQLSAQTVLEIPCANGRNIEIITSKAKHAIFADINSHMVKMANDKIQMKNLSNCLAVTMDICDLSMLSTYAKVDLILVPQQSFQLLNRKQAINSLQNMRKSGALFVMIDVYDFLRDSFDSPCFLQNDICFFDSSFNVVTRSSMLTQQSPNVICLEHIYHTENNCYETTVLLQNYTREEIIYMCVNAGFKIEKIFTAYNMTYNKEHGRTILLLKN